MIIDHLDPGVEYLVAVLQIEDGTLDHEQLLEKLWHWLKARDALKADGASAETMRAKIAGELSRNLAKLAQIGLLS